MVQRSREFFKRVTGRVRSEWAEIPFGHTPRKLLQPLDAPREGARDEKRNGASDDKNEERSEPQAAAERADEFIDGLERQSKTEHHRRRGAGILPHGIVEKIAAESCAAANGTALAVSKGPADLRTCRVIFHGLRIGF